MISRSSVLCAFAIAAQQAEPLALFDLQLDLVEETCGPPKARLTFRRESNAMKSLGLVLRV